MTLMGAGFLSRSMSILFNDPGGALWPITIISIFVVALNPPLAQIADLWGRKWVLVVGSAGAFVGEVIVSRAQNMDTVIAGFCFVGLAFGPQFALFAVVSEILPRKYRALSQAALNNSNGAGAIVGVVLSGALTRHNNVENYRIFCYVAAAIYGLGTVGIIFCYNPPPRELQTALSFGQKLQTLDWIGIFLSTAGLTLFSLSLLWYGNPYSFNSAQVLGPFIVGVVLLLAFIGYEWILNKAGIMNHKLFRHRNFPIALFIICSEGVAFITVNNYFVYEQVVVMGVDSWSASLRLLIYFGATIFFTTVAGVYTTRTKRITEPLILGFALYTAFGAAMSKITPSTTATTYSCLGLLAGAGNGFIIVNVVVAAQLVTPRDMIAMTTGLILAIRGVGIAFGTAIISAAMNNTLKSHLGPKVASAVATLGYPSSELGTLISTLALGNPDLLAQIPGVTPAIIGAATGALQNTYALAFRYSWLISLSFTAISCIGKLKDIIVCYTMQ